MDTKRPTLILEPTEVTLPEGRFVIHPDQRLLIGRTPGADLVASFGFLSRRQTWVWCEGGQWFVEDAGSMGGTYLDESHIHRAALPFGSILGAGGLRLRAVEGAPDETPTVPLGTPSRSPAQRDADDYPAAAVAPKPVPPPFAGRFELLSEIGRGTQGVVYKAFDRLGEANSPVNGTTALKVYEAGMTPEQQATFVRTALTNTTRYATTFVPHKAAGVHEGRAWLAMELVDGERLSDRLRAKPLTLSESVALAGKIAFDLGALHEEGMVHRNIHPGNVLLWRGEVKYPELSDRRVDIGPRRRPTEEPPVATRGFLAPIPALAGDWEPSDDVYSLAAILYLCAAGCMPVAGHDLSRERPVWQPLVEPQPLLEVRPDAPPGLADLLSRALSPHRQDRPANGRLLSFALLALEKNLGYAADDPPFQIIAEPGRPRRAHVPPRREVDPFMDEKFKDEVYELLRSRCPADSAIGLLHSITRAHGDKGLSPPPACALCGVSYSSSGVLEIRPEGFFPLPPSDVKRARSPFLCGSCAQNPHREAASIIQATIESLRGKDDQPMRDRGPTRRELRDGLTRLYAAFPPHLDLKAPCARCGSRGETLSGHRIDLCYRCLDQAGAARDEWYATRAREAEERLRVQYAKLYIRAEARRKKGLWLWSPTEERDVKLPAGQRSWSFGAGLSEVDALGRTDAPAQARIDEAANALAEAVEAHVVSSLRDALEKTTGDRFSMQGHSGLPGVVRAFMEKYRPGEPARERLVTAIFVMSELLGAGYRFVGQKDDYEWVDDTVYFEHFRELADDLSRS